MRFAGGTAFGAPTAGTFVVGDFVVDETGTVWICTAAGSPGTWAAQQSPDPLANALGFINWNYNPAAGGASTTFGTGIVYLMSVWLPPGKSVSKIILQLTAASSGTAPTGVFFGLASPTGVMLAQTADQHAGSFTAGNKSYSLSGSYLTNPTDSPSGLYYVVVLVNGTWSVTQPQFLCSAQNGNGGGQVGSGAWNFATGVTTGQTALPANAGSIAGGLGAASSRGFCVGVA